MPYVRFEPAGITIFAPEGKSILDIALENDIELGHDCGGVCACTSCKIDVVEGINNFFKISIEEIERLTEDNKLAENSRLGCQCIISKENNETIIIKIPD